MTYKVSSYRNNMQRWIAEMYKHVQVYTRYLIKFNLSNREIDFYCSSR